MYQLRRILELIEGKHILRLVENNISFQDKEGGYRWEYLAKFWLLADKKEEKDKIYKNSKIKQRHQSVDDRDSERGGGKEP